jgi:hypothetical protein
MLGQEAPTPDQAHRGPKVRAASQPPRRQAGCSVLAASAAGPAPAERCDALAHQLQRVVAGPAPAEQRDLLAYQLQRVVAGRAQLARMLMADSSDTDAKFIGKFATRHSDDKLLGVHSVIRSGTTITHFKLKLADDEFVDASVTDPEYGWGNDKASKRNWLKLKTASTATVTVTDDWLAHAPPETDSNTIFTLPTSRIRYTQNSISSTFSRPTPSGARTLDQAAAALKNGSDTLAGMPPLMIVRSQAKDAVRSLDNRRLWVAKRANKGAPRVRWASAAEQKTNAFKWTGDGKSIVVRG